MWQRRDAERVDATFDASRHVVLPGLVNTHHHFYQTLTRAHPSAINKPLFPWLVALYPIWARLKPNHLRLASRLALTELMLSGAPPLPIIIISIRRALRTQSTSRSRRRALWPCA